MATLTSYQVTSEFQQHFIDPNAKPVEIVTFPEDIENGAPTFLLERFQSILEKQGAKKLPVFIISITGVFRSGKSFLLNLMKTYIEYYSTNDTDDGWEKSLEQPIKGGAWAKSKRAVTEGIWLWDSPFIINGVAIYLMDCQGSGDAVRSSPTLDNLILYMGLQMAQVQILNLKSNLQSTDLERLQLCADYADVGVTDATLSQTPESLFDSLIFLVRDWQNGDEYGELPNEFIEILKEAKAGKIKRFGEGIQKAFEIITTFVFPHPGRKVGTASEKDNLVIRDVDQGFVMAAKCLFQKLFLFLPLHKRLMNGRGTVRAFQALENRCVDSELSKIKIQTGAEALEESLIHRAFVEASNYYDEEMIKAYSLDYANEQAITDHLENIVSQSIQVFQHKKTIARYKDSKRKEEYLGLLRQKGHYLIIDEKKKYIMAAQQLSRQHKEYNKKLQLLQEEKLALENKIKEAEEEEKRRKVEQRNSLMKEKEQLFKKHMNKEVEQREKQMEEDKRRRKEKMEEEISRGYTQQEEMEKELNETEVKMTEQKKNLDVQAEQLRAENERHILNQLENWIDEVDRVAKTKHKSKCMIM